MTILNWNQWMNLVLDDDLDADEEIIMELGA